MRSRVRSSVALVALLATAGCVSMPESGPVTTVPSDVATALPGTFDYQPEPPKAGDSPATIVTGFLDALRETPLTYGVARAYLTSDGSSSWEPGRRTIVYEDGTLATDVAGSEATVTLGSTVELDSRGGWLGDLSEGRPTTFDLQLVQEDGQWRIANPPDALIVSRTHFESRFVRYNLHFLDPSAQVLVPEPVYLPAGALTATLLASGLLAGPARGLQDVERTFFPPGTRLDLDVGIDDGVADVRLSREILATDSAQLDLAMAQLAWTLRQLPGVDRMKVTVDGAPVDQVTGASARSLSGWSSYDPTVAAAGPDLFALADREIVTVGEGDALAGVTGLRGPPIRSFGVSLGLAGPAQLALVAGDGRRLLTRPLADDDPETALRYVGDNLLRPAWDRFDNIWLVDRTAAGARVTVVPSDGAVHVLEAPGLTGEEITAFELSRDGTRLAAVVDGRVVLARIGRSESGRPTRVLAPTRLPLGQDADLTVDVAWTSLTTVGALVRLGPAISQVRIAGVDGSFLLDTDTSLEPLFQRATELATWPGAEAPVYLQAASGDLYDVSSTGHWTQAGLPDNLRGLTFAG
ncbi:MAG TPA: LpqB family beta-propeller domain-containing protein [Nocardioidaceae bacterium]|nr:LpqB family beta-propeller domain-containing protein [Nocardioidaceae bacterium]